MEHLVQKSTCQQADGDQRERLDKRKRCDRALFVRLFKAFWHPWLFLINASRYLYALDEVASNWPTDQSAQHQSKRRRGHRKLGGRCQTVLLTERSPPCSTRTVTAGQRNRACQQAHQGIEPQETRKTDTHGILDQ
ncbi:hypothetical protein D9M73_142190 [compost metagenome]